MFALNTSRTENLSRMGMKMRAQTKLLDSEEEVKRLMADVARAIEKAQEAMARVACPHQSVPTASERDQLIATKHSD
jgi:hypothetical protein